MECSYILVFKCFKWKYILLITVDCGHCWSVRVGLASCLSGKDTMVLTGGGGSRERGGNSHGRAGDRGIGCSEIITGSSVLVSFKYFI